MLIASRAISHLTGQGKRLITLPKRTSARRFLILSSLVDLHVPNCELFGGRSKYKGSGFVGVVKLKGGCPHPPKRPTGSRSRRFLIVSGTVSTGQTCLQWSSRICAGLRLGWLLHGQTHTGNLRRHRGHCSKPMIRSGLLTTFAIFMAVVMACVPSAAPDSPDQSPQGPPTPSAPTDTPKPVPTATPEPTETPTPPPTATLKPTPTPTPPPTIPDEIRNYIPPSPTPPPIRERASGDHGYVWRDRVPVVQGTPLEMPECAIIDALIMFGQQFPIVIDGETIPPLALPIYLIIRNGEIASVSKATGHFEIGENHKEPFQFLIDQLGESKMQLLPHEFYEENWGPFRQKALDEGC